MRKTAYLYNIAAGAFWGGIGLFVHYLSDLGFSQMQMVFIRSFVALLAMAPFLLIKDIRLFRVKWKDLWCFVGTGIFCLLLFNYCYFSAVQYTTMSVAAVLLYTAPGFVVVTSAIVFKEKITVKKVVALIVMFIGCMCVSGLFNGSQTITPAGFLFGIGSGICYSLYSLFSRFALNKGYSTYTVTFYTFLFASLGCLPFIGILSPQLITFPAVAFSLGLGIVSCLFPYILYTTGMRYVENGEAAMLATAEPVMATLLGVFVLHQAMTAANFFGIVLIIGGIFIINLQRKQRKEEEAEAENTPSHMP